MEEGQPRVNHRRVQQAVDTGAGTVATACPYCLTMFDEGIGSQQLQERLSVEDVAVYVARAMRPAADLAVGTLQTTASPDGAGTSG